jgi:hypothetical protein
MMEFRSRHWLELEALLLLDHLGWRFPTTSLFNFLSFQMLREFRVRWVYGISMGGSRCFPAR